MENKLDITEEEFKNILLQHMDENVKYIIGIDPCGILESTSVCYVTKGDVYTELLRPDEIIARFKGELTEDQIKTLENYGK